MKSEETASIEGVITRYILNTRTIIDGERLKRVAFGEKDKRKPHKTILLVGETGVGKSTMINAMVNYMLGVESNDRIWCEIIETKEKQTDSQTNAVTVYDVFSKHSPFSLTAIDTPGYGSTDGKKKDLHVAESLHELFRCKDHAIEEIDVVCIVMKSTTIRLNENQWYVFDGILSLFGNDAKKNIVVIITYVHGKAKNTIDAIKEAKLPCAQTDEGEPVCFRLNNDHCEDFNDEEILIHYPTTWNLLIKTMQDLQNFLNKSKPINLKITEAVLRKRKQLIASMFDLKDQIRKIELNKEKLTQENRVLQQHEKAKRDIINFEYEADEPYAVTEPIDKSLSEMDTCCKTCERNCHYPGCWWVTNLWWCSVMSWGKCTVCGCDYSKHVKWEQIYVTKTRKVKKTLEDLRKRYETKQGETKHLISKLEEEITKTEKEKSKLVEECYQCVVFLDEIALQSSSLYILQHLDFLIVKVKETDNTDQVKRLEELKSQANNKLLAQAVQSDH